MTSGTACATACLVCDAPTGAPVYRSAGPSSISSTSLVVDARTVVYVCSACGHIQTPPLADLSAYYDSAYNVHLESAGADDLYAVRDGVPVYRAQHQAAVALEKLALPAGARVLDYGCGKGMSLRALLDARPDLDGAVFDVSDAYRDAWDAIVPRERQAAYEAPAPWRGRFDAVLSFFALEHATDPRGFLRDVHALLRPGGTLHLTVPNVRRNVGDFIVVDHVNHFTPASLRRAFAQAGFADVRIDEDAHEAAFVVDAVARGGADETRTEPAETVAGYVAEAHGFARLWTAAADAVRAFEAGKAAGRRAAIYGSGFYGVFIAGCLADRSNLAYFLDRNPHQQAKRIFDRPVLAPELLGDDVEAVYLGLNPARAREIAAGVAPLHRRERAYFSL